MSLRVSCTPYLSPYTLSPTSADRMSPSTLSFICNTHTIYWHEYFMNTHHIGWDGWWGEGHQLITNGRFSDNVCHSTGSSFKQHHAGNDASGPPVSCLCPYCFHMLLIPRCCACTAAFVAAASVIPPAAHQYSCERFPIRSCTFRSTHSGETTTRKLRNHCVQAVSQKAPPTNTPQAVCVGPLLTQQLLRQKK